MTEENGENTDRINILVPVYRPDEKLAGLIYMMNRQSLKPDKMVFMVTVDADSTEEDQARALSGTVRGSDIPIECRFVRKAEFDHGGTRNRGMEYCDGQIVICMTQDAVPEDDHMVEELTLPFRGEFCGASGGVAEGREIIVSYARQMPAKDCRPVERFTRNFNYPPVSRIKTEEDLKTLGIKTFFASNVCAAYKKDLFLARGGFPEQTIFNEDMIFAGRAVRAGYAVAYAAGARVIHSHNLPFREQFKRNFDLAVSQADFPDVFEGVPSEGEGIRLVKSTMRYLASQGKIHLIPGLIWGSACKYAGYFLGKRYRKLPKKLVRAFSLNKYYWRNR
ncbi:MAG TPA: glycosyltransferase [Firmicutes bacterium]|nr:glycosyltransferase [Bacillota bacterium]